MPLTMMAARPSSSSGVSTLPTMSTTADSRMHSARMSAKNSTENTTADTPGRFGAMAISNVLADVRGMATIGPTHRRIAHMRILGRHTADALEHGLTAADAQQRKHGGKRKTDVRDEIRAESGQPRRSGFPCPDTAGRSRSRRPKNMENRAKPTTMISRPARFFVSFMIFSPLISQKGTPVSFFEYSVSFLLIKENRDFFMWV